MTPLGADGTPLEQPIGSGDLMTIQLISLADAPGRSGDRPPLPWERTLGTSESTADPTIGPIAMAPVRASRKGRRRSLRQQLWSGDGRSEQARGNRRRGGAEALPSQNWVLGMSPETSWGSRHGQGNPCSPEAVWPSSESLQEPWFPGAQWPAQTAILF